MTTNKKNQLGYSHKILVLACTVIVLALFGGILSTRNDSDSSTRNAAQGSSARTQDGQSAVTPSWKPLNLAMSTDTSTNTNSPDKTTNSPATTTNPTKGSSARPQNNTKSPASTTLLVPKAAKLKLASVAMAENQTYTSDNRLFVTGENGIFEIIGKANGDATVIQRMPKQSCAFGGIVETLGTLYVNCSGNGRAYVYAAAVTTTPSFQRIYTYKSAILPNGLTADNSGRLYSASTFFGQILRLTPSTSDPLVFASTGVWRSGAGPAVNGIKFMDNSLYWTDSVFVNRIAIKADGTPGKQERLFSALTLFDDLAVDKDGILVADYIKGSIRKYDFSTRSLSTVRSGLAGPSSVMRARAPFPAGSLIVTERNSGQVSLLTP